jgi:hypothetical protein
MPYAPIVGRSLINYRHIQLQQFIIGHLASIVYAQNRLQYSIQLFGSLCQLYQPKGRAQFVLNSFSIVKPSQVYILDFSLIRAFFLCRESWLLP